MSCFIDVIICVALSSTYVGSLYIWKNDLGRDHPSTIKKKFISVFLMTILSAAVVYFFADDIYFKDYTYWALMGIRFEGLFPAVVIPLLLTMVLFSGPLVSHYLEGMYQKSFDVRLWKYNICEVTWLRNHVVAPFSEEFTFRACMFPMLLPCFGALSVFICPLFFGIAHLHHLKEKLSEGTKLKVAILQSLFQLGYTTVFGVYSSYLFFRTGHVVAPFVAHAFCNYMGFPDFGLLLRYDQPRKIALMLIFACGLLSWTFLVVPLTAPALYSNHVYS